MGVPIAQADDWCADSAYWEVPFGFGALEGIYCSVVFCYCCFKPLNRYISKAWFCQIIYNHLMHSKWKFIMLLSTSRNLDRAQGVVCWCCLVAKSCLAFCDPIDCSPPGFSVHGILQARILESVAIPFSRESSWPRDWTRLLHWQAIHYCWAAREAPEPRVTK